MEPKPGSSKTAQVAEYMERKIASGEWDIGQPIPGLTDLADECGVSFGTVRTAQQILVDKGLLAEPEQGIPTRVIARPAPLDARDALALVRSTYRSLGEQLERLAAAAGPDASAPATDLRRLSTHQVHDYARFTAAAAALAYGYREVNVVGRQTRLLIDDRVAQVSSRRQPGSPWQFNLTRPVVDDAVAVIFVDLTGDYPDFYIAPAQWVRDDVKRHHDAWLETKGGVRPRNPASDHTAIELDRISQWHQRWDVLGEPATP
jgi:DNA-binding transcriptional regulator YhcF (GntR family)